MPARTKSRINIAQRPPSASTPAVAQYVAAHAEVSIPADIDALVTQHSVLLYRVAYFVCRNAFKAEDVVQQTFLRVLKRYGKMRNVRDERVWLIRIEWNVAHDRKRHAKANSVSDGLSGMERKSAPGQASAETSNTAQQACDHVLQLMDKLPRMERDVLLLSAVDELSTLQIAAILGTTEFSVRSCLYRAQREFPALLAEEISPAAQADSSRRIQAAPVA